MGVVVDYEQAEGRIVTDVHESLPSRSPIRRGSTGTRWRTSNSIGWKWIPGIGRSASPRTRDRSLRFPSGDPLPTEKRATLAQSALEA